MSTFISIELWKWFCLLCNHITFAVFKVWRLLPHQMTPQSPCGRFLDSRESAKALEVAGMDCRVVANATEAAEKDWKVISNARSHLRGLTHELSLTNLHLVYVTDVHDVTGLIHGTAAGADAFCIYLQSFSFCVLCIIEYTHTVVPNFHMVAVYIKACILFLFIAFGLTGQLRLANENSDCLAGDSSAFSNPVRISHTVPLRIDR